jgi:DNA-directed RNA polymerase specialized sigma24 family protein
MTPEAPPSDDEGAGLIALARAGDCAAWEKLFRVCYPTLILAVRRKLPPPLRSRLDPADFASDVMASLVANIERSDFPSFPSLLAYLVALAEQKVTQECRRRQRHEAH